MINIGYVNQEHRHTKPLALWSDSYCHHMWIISVKLLKPSVVSVGRSVETWFHVMREYMDVILENSTLKSAHIFMHQFVNVFDGAHAKESCIVTMTFLNPSLSL